MKDLDLATLTRPLSEQEPCGPDLEAVDDDDYLNAIVTAETVLPPEYYVFSDYIGRRQPFDLDRRYSDLDLGAQISRVSEFSERTRDLRLTVLLTKLCVLAKRLTDSAVCVESIAVLLEQQWTAVHPRAETGDFTLRREVLQRLDDPLIVTALQHIALFTNKRHGAITWHRYVTELNKGLGGDEPSDADRMLADEGQTNLSVLLPARDDLAQARATLAGLAQSLKRIRTACLEHMAGGPPSLSALGQLVDLLHRFVDRVYRLMEAAVVRLDPSAGREPPLELPARAADDATAEDARSAPSRSAGPAVASPADAAAALAAATGYFEQAEPSNPALLLLRQAQALIGKSFLEAMQILIPDQAAKAALEIGGTKIFALPLARLATTQPAVAAPTPSAAGEAPGCVPWPASTSRAEAVAVIERVGAYFRQAEPSSPIPMLTDGARALTGKDFMSLLGDLLPKDALKAATTQR